MLGFDLGGERFDRVTFASRIEGAEIAFDFHARSRRIAVRVRNGKIDREKGRIDAIVTIEVRGRSYKLRLRGPLERPAVIPLPTRDLVRKAEKELKRRNVEKKIRKALPPSQKREANPIGSFLRNLF
jgi:hypothetical protein